MPYYWSQIETLENLQYVAGLVDGFNQDRFLAALMGKRSVGKDKIVHMRNELVEITNKLEEEYLVLEDFGKTFNDKFATRNNACFSSAMTLLRKMRSGMSKMIQIYRQFASQNKAARRAAHAEDQTLDLYSHSNMGGQEYTLPLFDIDEFTPEVRELYEAMKRFMEYMGKSFDLCEDILEEEERIRQNPDECLERYQIFKDEHRAKIKDMLNAINLESRDFMAENNPAIKMRNESRDEKQFAKRGFHNLTEAATTALASKEIVEEARRGEFTAQELWLFDGYDRESIRRVRAIIQNFDTYLPEDYTRKTLPAKYIACLMQWCRPHEDKGFVAYFTKTYQDAGGKLSVPKNPAVNQQKNELKKSDSDYVSLVEKWERIA